MTTDRFKVVQLAPYGHWVVVTNFSMSDESDAKRLRDKLEMIEKDADEFRGKYHMMVLEFEDLAKEDNEIRERASRRIAALKAKIIALGGKIDSD